MSSRSRIAIRVALTPEALQKSLQLVVGIQQFYYPENQEPLNIREVAVACLPIAELRLKDARSFKLG